MIEYQVSNSGERSTGLSLALRFTYGRNGITIPPASPSEILRSRLIQLHLLHSSKSGCRKCRECSSFSRSNTEIFSLIFCGTAQISYTCYTHQNLIVKSVGSVAILGAFTKLFRKAILDVVQHDADYHLTRVAALNQRAAAQFGDEAILVYLLITVVFCPKDISGI